MRRHPKHLSPENRFNVDLIALEFPYAAGRRQLLLVVAWSKEHAMTESDLQKATLNQSGPKNLNIEPSRTEKPAPQTLEIPNRHP